MGWALVWHAGMAHVEVKIGWTSTEKEQPAASKFGASLPASAGPESALASGEASPGAPSGAAVSSAASPGPSCDTASSLTWASRSGGVPGAVQTAFTQSRPALHVPSP